EWWQVGAILPEVEKLFESPQERGLREQKQVEEQRLRRLRGGTITASVGFGLILLVLVISLSDEKFFGLIGPSLLVFMIGIGIVINGLFFTVSRAPKAAQPAKDISGKSDDELSGNPEPQNLFTPNQPPFHHLSVVENTTRNLVEIEKRDTNKIKQRKFNDE
ncbi:MAG TPA: hypothetical protein VNB22_03580, partial [Pyrinomonadaceae bacterium]|nr:hypothetical protein [Pyrinomonadaceae bacterium]